MPSIILLSMLVIFLKLLWAFIWFLVTTWVYPWAWIWPAGHCRLMQEVAQLFSFDRYHNSSLNYFGAIDVKIDGSVLEEKSSDSETFLYLLNLIRALASSLLLKLLPRKLVRSMKFLSREAALYLYKSTIQPSMESCFIHGLVLITASWICWISCRNGYIELLVLHLLPLFLVRRCNVTSLNL